ncbi:MAG: Gfo/Idh/MocA family oxidoreductase [Candidatus Poribacteria bacterium]|nr:Gfo/Idh/MocA family oxidoreductase [Candidatus Poribacteria bacterium]
MRPTRVAVIGCGRIASDGHLPAYRAAAESGLCTLVGVCDVIIERAQEAARQYGVRPFDKVGEMIAETQPEVVSITTMPSSHYDLTLQALNAGCHVLCEKPVAMNLGEATEMVQAAQRADRLLSICFEYRYWDESVYLRDRLAAGDFGHVHAARTWGGAVYGFPTSRGFHRLASAGGGVLTHWTIHNLDLALWLLGNPEPLTASAFCHQRLAQYPAALGPSLDAMKPESGIEDFAMGFVRLAGGAVVTVEANFLQSPSGRHEGWEFLGERGAASIAPIRVWLDRGDEWIDDTPVPGTLAPCDYRMERLIAGFLQAVRTGGKAPVSGAEILRIQRLMDALYASAACGHEVTVETPLSNGSSGGNHGANLY